MLLDEPEGEALEYSQVTHNIRVSVEPEYLEHQSDPEEPAYVWAYHITVENLGDETVQLISRHWVIIDAHGQKEEVRGPGVVGEQPVLRPGEKFEYSSFTHLPTDSGFMSGSYQMITIGSKDSFEIEIPTFALDIPGRMAVMH